MIEITQELLMAIEECNLYSSSTGRVFAALVQTSYNMETTITRCDLMRITGYTEELVGKNVRNLLIGGFIDPITVSNKYKRYKISEEGLQKILGIHRARRSCPSI